MAIEEANNESNPAPPSPAPAPALAPSPVNPSLPPYPEMIMAAIESLNDPNGSNKSLNLKTNRSHLQQPPACSLDFANSSPEQNEDHWLARPSEEQLPEA